MFTLRESPTASAGGDACLCDQFAGIVYPLMTQNISPADDPVFSRTVQVGVNPELPTAG
jgi:hypothetical protein